MPHHFQKPVTDETPLSAADFRKIVYDWNATETAYPRQATIPALFAAQAARTPGHTAVTFEGRSLTYAELEARANKLARHLRGLGVTTETLVALLVERSLDMAVAMLGISKAGGAYIPIDPNLPASRIAYMLADAQPPVIVGHAALLDDLPDMPTAVRLDADWPAIAAQPAASPEVALGPRNLLYVIYTSGSTGTPKGVAVEHRGAVNHLHSMMRRPGFSAADHVLAVTSIAFDPAMYEIFLPLISGAQVTIASSAGVVDGDYLQRLIDSADITFMRGAPANWRILLESGWQGKADLKLLSGGEALTHDLAEQLLPRCGALWNMYGPTETTVTCTLDRIEALDGEISIGRPFDNTQAYILDTGLNPVPQGEAGDLYIGGDGVARGYLNRPELTAERFLPNPFARAGSGDAPSMYRTGDRARFLPDGRIVYLGREDYQVKVRGYRIELGEIEAVLNGYPGVAQAVTLLREDTTGEPRLVAYLVAEPERLPPEAGALRAYLRRRLPDYMVPARFVLLDRFPVTPQGKVDRQALPVPDRADNELSEAYVAPRTEREQLLADLFARLLNLEQISVDESFFDVGGNSLLATRLVREVRDRLDGRVSLRSFLEQPTIAGLAAALDTAPAAQHDASADGRASPAARPAANGTDLLSRSNLTRGQFLMWMGQEMNPDAPLYNVVHAFTIDGALDIPALQHAFALLVAHTDVLRTVIEEHNGVPQQRVLAGPAASLPLLDFSAEQDPDAACAMWLEERKMRLPVFDRKLYDTALLKLGGDRHVWYLCQHHIITDAVSSELLFKRLAEYYQRALDGRLDALVPPPQFADFVPYERALRGTSEFAAAEAYWQEKYQPAQPPTDFYGKATHDVSLQTVRRLANLGRERSAALRRLAQMGSFASPSSDLSLFAVFMTLLFTTLHRLNGQRRLRVGTPYHGRPTASSQEIIGLFIEMGVLQVEISEEETFFSLGQKVMAETLDGLEHVLPGISSPDTNRAYDVVLNYIQTRFRDFAGLPVRREPLHTGYIDSDHNFRLQVTDFDDDGSFELAFDLKTDVFGEVEQSWLVDQFLQVTDAFIADPQQGLGAFSMLTAAQRRQLLRDYNDTDAPYPASQTVVQLFEEQVAQTPEAAAAVQDGQVLTYAALNGRANQLARYLQEQGVGPEKTVALAMERSLDVLVAIWGVLKAGGAYIPLDPAYPRERLAYMLADAAPVLVLVDAPDRLGDLHGSPLPRVDVTALDLSGFTAENLPAVAAPHNLVYLIYTSGSTGRPKGTMLLHRGLVNYAWWARRQYQAQGERLDFPLYSSLAFDLTVTSLFVPLLSGGKIVVYGEAAEAPGLEVLQVFADDAVDIVKLTPAHLALVRETQPAARRIRKLIVGGEDFKTELANAIHKLFNGAVEIYNEYGPTEAVVGCMIHRFDPAEDTAVSVPIGVPAANARIYLLDEYDQPVPPGVTGEMIISSDGVARGYLNRPDLTAERFGPDLFRPGARIYRTGDIARWDAQGRMVFLGRRDHQVKISGARIELGEIEARLQSHPAIQDAVASVVQFERHLEAHEVSYCSACGLPSNFPNVSFNAAGVCSLCTDFDAFREDVFHYFKTMDDLEAIVAKAKTERRGDYDCMMLYSGGKDSTYVLAQLVEMGLKVLAFSLDNGYISEEAKENVRKVTEHLGVDLVFATTPHMNAIFADSLERYSNVCQGCYKVIYTLSMKLAREKGIKYIFTGLSRGQLFETRLDELFRNRIFDVAQMDAAVLEARKVYHRVNDAVYQLLDVSMFADDRIFGEVQFVDYFRYTDVELEDVYAFLSTRVPWIRPRDTGRSTNCLINEAGIFVHQTERGYHNYALPYSWDVRLGHKTREEALEELDDDLRLPMVQQMLDEVGYTVKEWHADQSERRLAAYYVSGDESVTNAEVRAYLAETLPAHMIPSYFVRLEALPLTPNGKVNRQDLPNPAAKRPEMNAPFVAPQAPLEQQLAAIWAQTLNVSQIGINDNFFDLGGASIPAVQTVARISEQFGVAFPVSGFFEHPTIAGQAAMLEELFMAQIESLSDEEAARLLEEMDNGL